MPGATSAGTSEAGQLLPLKRSGRWFRSGWQWEDGGPDCRQGLHVLLYNLIKLYEPSFDPAGTNVHLARNNKIDDPIDVWLDGRFDDWQCWQRQRNFDRDLVLSLV
jgi:hypothetical protein